jgi:hypothetical protein
MRFDLRRFQINSGESGADHIRVDRIALLLELTAHWLSAHFMQRASCVWLERGVPPRCSRQVRRPRW